MTMLNSVYESTQIKPKKPFTEENLRDVVEGYNRQYEDSVVMDINDGVVEFTTPKDQFSFINMIDMTLQKTKGYKLIDDKLIMEL